MFSVTVVDDKINSHRYREYLLDFESDVNNLPTSTKRGTQENSDDSVLNDTCGIGSKAFVIDTSTRYILGNDDVWHRITDTEGGLIVSAYIDSNNHLKFVLNNGLILDSGIVNVLPDVSESDNGKIMKVIDGKWTLVDNEKETLTVETEDTAGNSYTRML